MVQSPVGGDDPVQKGHAYKKAKITYGERCFRELCSERSAYRIVMIDSSQSSSHILYLILVLRIIWIVSLNKTPVIDL